MWIIYSLKSRRIYGMNKKLMYLGLFPIVTTLVILGFFFLLFPMGGLSEVVYFSIAVTIYLGMLLGWGFIYVTSEGWKGKELIKDDRLRSKILFPLIVFSAVLTTILASFGNWEGNWSLLKIAHEGYTLVFYFLLFLVIPWAAIDLYIWAKKNK